MNRPTRTPQGVASILGGTGRTPFRLAVPIAVLAAVALLVFASSAVAAPRLGITVERRPAALLRGDEQVEYTIDLTNTTTATPPQVGDTYTCQPGTWSPALSSPQAPNLTYEWLRNGAVIPGAAGPTYRLTAEDEGHSVQCAVFGETDSSASLAISAPIVVSPPPSPVPPSPLEPGTPSARPTIEGSFFEARTCTPPSGWSGSPTWSYQWLREGSPIAGATGTEYVPGAEDRGKTLECEAIGENGSGAAAAISEPTFAGTFEEFFERIELGIESTRNESPPSLIDPNSTSGPTSVFLGLPAGLALSPESSGAGWGCQPATQTCTTSRVVAPGAAFPPLDATVWITPGAPGAVSVAFTASGGGAPSPATAADSFLLGPATPFGLTAFSARAEEQSGTDYTQAGGHPFSATTTLDFTEHRATHGSTLPVGSLRDAVADLPAGFVANPQAISEECTFAQLKVLQCPASSAVGNAAAYIAEAQEKPEAPVDGILYKLKTEKGYPAEFGFRVLTANFVFRAKVRSDGDYGITAIAPLTPRQPWLWKVDVTLCSNGPKFESKPLLNFAVFLGCRASGEAASNPIPFLSNQTRCAGASPVTELNIDSWEQPGRKLSSGFPDRSDPDWKTYRAEAPPMTGCQAVTEAWTGRGAHPAEPSFTFRPQTTQADTPSGYAVDLHVPQDGLKDPDGLRNADLDGATVTLPRGVALSPSAANGLEACSEEQMGLTSEQPLHFNFEEPRCPNASKVGTLEVNTPLLEDPLKGSVYLARQDANPFHSRFAIYLAVDDEKTGVVIKLAGRVSPDPVTGQITTTFENNPQLPFEDFKLDFFGGSRASLVNPSTCGAYTTQTQLTPWSAVDPEHPTAAETAIPTDRFTIGSGPGGGACAATPQGRGFAPGLNAGVQGVGAGAHSPFVLHLTRNDGEQEFASLDTTLPPGSAATLANVPQCADSAIATAEHKSGKAELASPSCPAATQVGTLTTTAGAGTTPYSVTGRAYLAGPYKGAPLSLVFITPAVAGPFDLGNVVVRAAAEVDPTSAQITVKTDAIPTILEGVPLQIRSIVARIDRPNFTVNPTSCERMAVTADVAGSSGATAKPSNAFQVQGCSGLGLTPKLKLRLKGGTRRAKYPALIATLTQPSGQANLRFVRAVLPRSEFLAQEHIRTICTRVQFNAGGGGGEQCPKGSVYGHAEAWSPLLGYKLTGPVFLRSNGGERELPDLLAALKGPDWQPIRIDLLGFVDSVHRKGQQAGGIRTTFATVPDAPVSRFVLRMGGGSKSLLRNSEDLCHSTKAKRRATVRIIGQNNKRADQFPVVTNQCHKHKKAKKQHARHGRGQRSPGKAKSK